ncbi:hypothetical protein CgunFtcFv8_011823 [Champsocephalus gunnari]|uniref:NF-kappa-B inhibitor-like protein 2 n=1 Tax=Champsocephalus gunnari TaxID=52237 RepID=A0AAN8D5E2_CHAGU|nr:hypothetical protein CgunFtcFv8_011823 [Champsocephalus gunnari]
MLAKVVRTFLASWADGSDGEEDEEEEMDNSEPLEDSDANLSESDDDLEGYDKMVSGRREAGRMSCWNKSNEKGETSLHRACIDGNLKQAQYLMEQNNFSSSDDSDSESAVNPLCGVCQGRFPAAPSQKEVRANKEANPIPISGRETLREAPAPTVFQRDEYHSAIRGLSSSKTLIQGLSQPQFSSTHIPQRKAPCPHDLLLAVLHTNEEVLAEVCSWDLPPLPERYSGGRAGEGGECLKGQCHPAFPCLEELDLSVNQLGDGVSESPSCLLSCCPLLARLSLQGCSLTARFLQQHRLLLANALSGTGHLKSVCLSHNALGSTGFELVLKTLPLHSLTHLDLSAVRRGPADSPALEPLAKILSQEECSLTHLSLAANGLTDSSVVCVCVCLPSCPTLVNLNLSGNPSVTSAGLNNILISLREACRPLNLLNLQGCEVCGPWDTAGLDGLSELVQDLRLCSQGLNKLDRQALKQSWDSSRSPGRFINRNSRCLLSTPASS